MQQESSVGRYRDLIVVLLLILIPLSFYLSNSKESRDHNSFDRAVVWVSSPIQWLVVASLDGAAGLWNSYVNIVGAAEENIALREQVAVLGGQLLEHAEQAEESRRLRLLLGMRDRAPLVKAITAEIIADAPTPLFRSVRVDRGRSDGVEMGAAVVNHSGIVGRVAGVGEHSSEIMLLVDANSSTDVLVQRTRARARVRGSGRDGTFEVEVEHLARTADVRPGDILITSGVGTVFPKGLRVGVVRAVEQGAFGLYQQAEVDPSVDFHRLEELLILPGGWPNGTSYEHSEKKIEPTSAEDSTPSQSPSQSPQATAPETSDEAADNPIEGEPQGNNEDQAEQP